MSETIYHLKIKTQKVQSFIFKVPKLKAMLGANSLLGEFFAEDLRIIRAHYEIPQIWTAYFINNTESLPAWEIDDINKNFKKGVICSAGGHFESFFNDEQSANKFIKAVQQKAQDKLPGVRLSFFLKKYDPLPEKFKKFDDGGEIVPLPKNTSEILIDNPYFYPSDQDGENPQLINGYRNASGKKDKDSQITKQIKEAGDNFYKGNSKDYLCKFLKSLSENDSKKVNFSEVFENDLEKLAKLSLIPKNNKIAIIAIDGNAMGNRFRAELDKAKGKEKDKPETDGKNTIEAMISFEKFWFEQRNTFREALKAALIKIPNCPYSNKKGEWKYPFQVLMLGGDDLLIVTVPEIAFDLVKNFGDQLEQLSKDKNNKLSVSAGIAFVKYSFPFSQAHELAESLLSSAKVKSRIWETKTNEKGKKYRSASYINALDWHVHFPTGTEDIDEIRKHNYLLKYKKGNEDQIEILTQRPCTMEKAREIWEASKTLYNNIINQPKESDLNQETYENSSGRNKYKSLRTLLKTGESNVQLFGKLQELEDEFIPFKFLSSHKEKLSNKAKLNTAFDVIELMDFHKREEKESK